MANKQILSVVAASILAASFTFTGCGSSSSSSSEASSSSSSEASSSSSSEASSSSSSEASSSSIGAPISVTVSDAYVYGAMVKVGDVEYATANGATYEFPEGTVSGTFSTKGGANDTNGNGIADGEDPIAPAMAAPAGYKNINTFTTMKVNGKTLEEIQAKYPSLAAMTSLDFDVTKADLAIYKDAAKAGLELAKAESGDTSSSSVASSSSEGSIVPDPTEPTSSVASSSSEASTSSSDSIVPDPFGSTTLRAVIVPDPFANEDVSGSTASSVEASASSVAVIVPDLEEAFKAIDAATDKAGVDAAVAKNAFLGKYVAPPASSSEAATSSEAANNCPDGTELVDGECVVIDNGSSEASVSSEASTSSEAGSIVPDPFS